ncbi:hypothetical protein V1L52_10465 [Treponema sp. HNW]|uniref:hypothetical protein n=1 Tax=Treponema sp. HNW TaxID=3116654 RepID=UPI003D130823
MKINHNFAAVCIVLGVVLFGISMRFDHIIGGNAVRGYREDGVYMVHDKSKNVFMQVSKPVWYINYVYTCITMMSVGTAAFFCIYLNYKYL